MIQDGPGQRDKAAAEQRTAQVAAENKAGEDNRAAEANRAAGQSSGPKTAAEKVMQSSESGETPAVDDAVLVDPYPAYDEMSVGDLRSAAKARKVEINRDVEKAHLVHQLRLAGESNPAYDLMPLEELRGAASGKDVELDEEFEKAHLITELRAADTRTG